MRLTKYSNDLIRNKAVNILRKLDSKNGLNGDELAIISSFCLIERVENNQLKKYEDLDEQGKLLKLLCAVGDTVYYRYDGIKIAPMRVEEMTITPCGVIIFRLEYCGNDEKLKYWRISLDNLAFKNKILFLTKEEAEAILKELSEK